MHDLSRDPVIPVAGADASAASLPEVLAHLSAGREIAFPGLAAHQRQAWFCFLVQLAAMAVAARDETDPPITAEGWRERLAGLAGADADTAYALFVEDIARPAFLQPPVHDAKAWARFRPPILEPDAIDVLVTAKNHDVKSDRIGRAAAHHWLYALLTLQTQQGFLGRGNYGIARMNGGFSSRAFAGRLAGHGWAARFRRDLRMLLGGRAETMAQYDIYARRDGLGLLWLEPWDDDESLPPSRLDPYFVEVCRRVRLVACDDGLGLSTRPSEAARVAAAVFKGVLGDPWAPVDTKNDPTALTIGAGGFDYRRVARIVAEPRGWPMALRSGDADAGQDVELHFQVLVRGQGRTDGLHERIVHVPRHAAERLRHSEALHDLRERLERMLDDVGNVTRRALKVGLLAYVQGGPEQIDFTDDRCDPWLSAFDDAVDVGFLDWLWRGVDLPDNEVEAERARWQGWLAKLATEHFYRGIESLAVPSERRERARATAERVFAGAVRRILPDAWTAPASDDGEAAA